MSLTDDWKAQEMKKYSQHTRKWENKKESVDLSPEKLQAEIDRLEETLTRFTSSRNFTRTFLSSPLIAFCE